MPAVSELDIFLREVEFQFEEACEVEQLLSELLEFLSIATAELADGETVLSGCDGVDEVGDGFGLREVETSIEESPLGEFSGLRQACAGVDEGLEQCLL